MELILLLLNILLLIAVLVLFYLLFRWLIPKLGLPADATAVILFIVALLIVIYIIKNGFPAFL